MKFVCCDTDLWIHSAFGKKTC